MLGVTESSESFPLPLALTGHPSDTTNAGERRVPNHSTTFFPPCPGKNTAFPLMLSVAASCSHSRTFLFSPSPWLCYSSAFHTKLPCRQNTAIPLMVSVAVFAVSPRKGGVVVVVVLVPNKSNTTNGDRCSVFRNKWFTTVAVPPILWRGSAGAHYGIYTTLGKNNYWSPTLDPTLEEN